MLPPEYIARCPDPRCSWHINTPDREYRDRLAAQHHARYGHTPTRTDLT